MSDSAAAHHASGSPNPHGPARSMSIGEVLAALRDEFPDASISKIRFLEEQGLVEPERTPSGYRKFSHEDVERLRYVLSVQRERYLPLRVIREHLEALDEGTEAPLVGNGPGRPRLVGEPVAPRVRLDRVGLCEAAGISPELLAELESFGVVAPPRHGGFDEEALVIARTAGELSRFGIGPRHLRTLRVAADREASLVEQVVAPLRRQRGPEAAGRAEETSREIAALFLRLHSSLLKDALDDAGE